MMSASQGGDGGKIAGISKQIHACNSAIEERFERLEKLYGKKEEIKLKYERALGA